MIGKIILATQHTIQPVHLTLCSLQQCAFCWYQSSWGKVGDEGIRVQNNYEWVKNNMAKYSSQGMKTFVVFAHAAMDGDRNKNVGKHFWALLENQYPDILVLYA